MPGGAEVTTRILELWFAAKVAGCIARNLADPAAAAAVFVFAVGVYVSCVWAAD